MPATKRATDNPLDQLPTAKDLMKQIALKEAAKAAEARHLGSLEAEEKKALIEKFSKPSGVSNDERIKRAAAIIKRAADNGRTEVEVGRFPNLLFSDRGRAINQQEAGWENTLIGLPKELYEFWRLNLKPRGYGLKLQIVDFPEGMPGDIGMSLTWASSARS
jgi:hypothetical protein